MSSENPTVPYGYCHCGCGRKTNIAPHNSKGRGHIKGEPVPYLRGHRLVRLEDSYEIDESTGCWVWTACIGTKGYGKTKRNGRTLLAHRYSYELTKGPIPEGLVIDHLCRNRRCVNPDHLEAVTVTENNHRSPPWSVQKGRVA